MQIIGNATVYNGDCLDILPTLLENSVDSIVTDPPYGISFMGANWDHGIPGKHFWEEALRVAKPGAHLLAFGGTRTYHRLACAIEDAGWEIRDCIMWVYGQGFPKSLDISKAIDKQAGVEREVIGNSSTVNQKKSKSLKASVIHSDYGQYIPITSPATDAAKLWGGWGTALKPAYEPIILARKPISESTIADNVLKHGTGGINIDECRIVSPDNANKIWVREGKGAVARGGSKYAQDKPQLNGVTVEVSPHKGGRFPSNFIHDGSEEVTKLFPNVNKQAKCKTDDKSSWQSSYVGGKIDKPVERKLYLDEENGGSAARFFYCAKASKADRTENNIHPTVKPTALMQYLCKLVTPKGGIILDPFMGSGSTGKAALLDNFNFIGIELENKYFIIAEKRITHAYFSRSMF